MLNFLVTLSIFLGIFFTSIAAVVFPFLIFIVVFFFFCLLAGFLLVLLVNSFTASYLTLKLLKLDHVSKAGRDFSLDVNTPVLKDLLANFSSETAALLAGSASVLILCAELSG